MYEQGEGQVSIVPRPGKHHEEELRQKHKPRLRWRDRLKAQVDEVEIRREVVPIVLAHKMVEVCLVQKLVWVEQVESDQQGYE